MCHSPVGRSRARHGLAVRDGEARGGRAPGPLAAVGSVRRRCRVPGAVDGAPPAAHDRGVAGQTCGSGAAACIAADQARAFVAGQLAPAERSVIERRIEACAGCRAVVAEAARRAGAEPVYEARGRAMADQPAVTAALRGGRHSTPAGADAAGPDRAAALEVDRPIQSEPVPARVTGREATAPALLLDEHGEVIGRCGDRRRGRGQGGRPVMASGWCRRAPRPDS